MTNPLNVPWWRHNDDTKQWELMVGSIGDPQMIGYVTDDLLEYSAIPIEELLAYMSEHYPHWPPFPDKEKRDKMNKRNDEPGFSAGSRTEKAHDPNGWQLGGRQDEDRAQYDPNLAAQHAQDHQDRQGK